MLIISVRSLASNTLTNAGGCSVVWSLELVPDFPGPLCMSYGRSSGQGHGQVLASWHQIVTV